MLFKSNIQPLSNVFPLSNGILDDGLFHDQVRGKKAIDIMVDRLKRYTGDNKLLTEEQMKQSEEGMYCALMDDKKELVFGYIQVDGKLKSECRCYKHQCRHFKSCRPQYDLSVLPRPFNYDLVRDYMIPENEAGETNIASFPATPNIVETKEVLDDNEIFIDFSEDDFDYVIDLDEESGNPQDLVINALPTDKMLVTAGPGTGKTYTLLKRIEHLVLEHGVDINNMVILSFSRAAISEIRQRNAKMLDLNEYGYHILQDVDIRTFDSFATYLLKEVVPELDLTGKDYDTRIGLAIDCIKKHPEIFNFTEHIIVDEIQDLVGVRARLVQTILQHTNCGFTFLGDPCQAIYEYQVAKLPNELGSLAFLNWLEETYGNNMVKHSFDHNFRQAPSLARVGHQVRKRLLEESETNQANGLIQAMKTFKHLGGVQTIASQLEFQSEKKYAFLCRDNGKVLKVSQLLRDQNIKHLVQRPSTQKMLDRKLGEILGGFNRRFLEQDELKTMCHDAGYFDDQDINVLWMTLKRIEKGHGSRIDMEQFRNELGKGLADYTGLESRPLTNVVVSSIHRAKGREYDEVILLDNDFVDRNRWLDISDEVRTYYVAMTRPKEILWLASLDQGYQRKVRERWVYSKLSRKHKPFVAQLEMGLEKDIDVLSFVDLNMHGSEEKVLKNQRYIIERVKSGDPVILVKSRESDLGFVRYNIIHDGNYIGSMSRTFSDDLFQALKEVQGVYSRENLDYYPAEINEVYVDDVCSHIAADQNIDGVFGKSAIWNGVLVTGLGHLSWLN